ncbi:MAG: tetratricopeptide repeat protein [Candidatus Micrarchaeota archaeon]
MEGSHRFGSGYYPEKATPGNDLFRDRNSARKTMLEIALDYLKNKEFRLAIGAFTEVIENYESMNKNSDKYSCKNLAQAYCGRAKASIWIKNREDALEDFSKGIEIYSRRDDSTCDYRNSEARNQRANLYIRAGKFEKAEEDLIEAKRLNPDNFHTYNNFGKLRHKQGKYCQAIENFEKAIKINPRYFSSYSFLADAFLHIGKYEKAIESYTRAIKYGRNNIYHYNERGRAKLFLENKKREIADYSSAIEDFDMAIKLKKDHVFAWANRGIAYYKSGNYDAAIENLKWADELTRNNGGRKAGTDVYFYLAKAYSEKGEYGLAEENIKKAIKLREKPKYVKLLDDIQNIRKY